jgi:hypothetical protein
MNKRVIISFVALLCAAATFAQDIAYAREVIEKLCSGSMHGRGYVKKGDKKAAGYITAEFSKLNLIPLGHQYYQFLPVDINTFPAAMSVIINGKSLKAGYDFLAEPYSPGIRGTFAPRTVRADQWLKETGYSYEKDYGVLVVDERFADLTPEEKKTLNNRLDRLSFQPSATPAAIVEITHEKLLFGASDFEGQVPRIKINAAACPDSVTGLKLRISNRFVRNYETQNVAGYFRGTACPDSFVVFTAHYDHLGMMGRKTRFPGANDNASGVAMLLNLAAYFASHPPRYSVAFIAFAGEEAGLVGSRFFVESPLIELSRIKFLLNLDLVGTGSEGIAVVNGSVFTNQLALLMTLNKENQRVTQIKSRGEACNSDHCMFYRNGVPCFFIYTLGGPANYHDPDDVPEKLTLTAFEGLTWLLIYFSEAL